MNTIFEKGLVATIDGASKAGKFSTIATSILSFSMSHMLSSIRGLSLICTIACLKIVFPAVL
jgi:hypothetical protein